MNTVLIDIDGTMFPITMKEYLDNYMMLLKNRLETEGYDADKIIKCVYRGLGAMLENDGMYTNEEVFWTAFEDAYYKDGKGDKNIRQAFEKLLMDFYKTDYGMIRYLGAPEQDVSDCVKILKDKGYQVVAASTPVLPDIAQRERIEWSGCNPDDFALITGYENSCYAKPNLKYYEHLMRVLDKDPGDCLMVGNDVKEDMCAAELGIDVYLIEGYVENKDNADTSIYKSGDWKAFKEYVNDLPSIN